MVGGRWVHCGASRAHFELISCHIGPIFGLCVGPFGPTLRRFRAHHIAHFGLGSGLIGLILGCLLGAPRAPRTVKNNLTGAGRVLLNSIFSYPLQTQFTKNSKVPRKNYPLAKLLTPKSYPRKKIAQPLKSCHS